MKIQCFWYTFEFGLCRQEGKLRAFGGALLSSFGELEYCFSGQVEMKPFDPPKTALTEHPITKYQHVYFVSESIEDAKQKLLYDDYQATFDKDSVLLNDLFNYLQRLYEKHPTKLRRALQPIQPQYRYREFVVRYLTGIFKKIHWRNKKSKR